MAAKDKELEAISSIISLLKPLDETERSRVLEYVLKRLQMATIQASAISAGEFADAAMPVAAPRAVTDIRTLTAEKQPRSANEMAALVAYYLSELAPQNERSPIIMADMIRRYFKMAGFPLPRVLTSVLTNAAAAGYLENVKRGEYRLNPVGYNLVVHGLPRSSGPGPTAKAGRPIRKVATRKNRKAGRPTR